MSATQLKSTVRVNYPASATLRLVGDLGNHKEQCMRIAFLGLGIMGRPMAANLVKAGHEVLVWNRTARQHVDGARTAVSPAEAALDAEVVWTCVADTAAEERVIFSEDGVEKSLREGMIIVDSSTISPSATLRFAER